MSKELTSTKLKMAALGNDMIEAGAEIYIDTKIKNKLKNKPENIRGDNNGK